MKPVLAAVLLSALFVGCASTAKQQARAKSAQLHPGMTQAEVVRLFGNPTKAESKAAGFNFGQTWGGFEIERRKEDQFVWEYDAEDLTIAFEKSGKGWVVKSWDLD